MAFFSGKNSSADKDKFTFDDDEKNENETSFGTPAIVLSALIYILCFTFLLSFTYQAGKFMEYRVPLPGCKTAEIPAAGENCMRLHNALSDIWEIRAISRIWNVSAYRFRDKPKTAFSK